MDYDPQADVPQELLNLTKIEKLAICQVITHVQITRVGQRPHKVRGNNISLNQPIYNLVTKLPHLPEDLLILNLVTKKGAVFKANRKRIQDALEWLQRHNPHYQNITIDGDALARYPENGGDVIGIPEVQLEEEAGDGGVDEGPDHDPDAVLEEGEEEEEGNSSAPPLNPWRIPFSISLTWLLIPRGR